MTLSNRLRDFIIKIMDTLSDELKKEAQKRVSKK